DHHEVVALERRELAASHRHALLGEGGDRRRVGGQVLVETRHLGAAREAERGSGATARAEPHHGHLLLRQVHRSFSEARLTSASSIETIQKRTMIFGSAQPFFSKW